MTGDRIDRDNWMDLSMPGITFGRWPPRIATVLERLARTYECEGRQKEEGAELEESAQ